MDRINNKIQQFASSFCGDHVYMFFFPVTLKHGFEYAHIHLDRELSFLGYVTMATDWPDFSSLKGLLQDFVIILRTRCS